VGQPRRSRSTDTQLARQEADKSPGGWRGTKTLLKQRQCEKANQNTAIWRSECGKTERRRRKAAECAASHVEQHKIKNSPRGREAKTKIQERKTEKCRSNVTAGCLDGAMQGQSIGTSSSVGADRPDSGTEAQPVLAIVQGRERDDEQASPTESNTNNTYPACQALATAANAPHNGPTSPGSRKPKKVETTSPACLDDGTEAQPKK
jgi:hypothetical protein